MVDVNAPSELKAYLQKPFNIAKYQCIVHANNRLINTTKDILDYYDLDISGHTNLDFIKKNTLIEVIESRPCNVLKQLSFYEKCKTFDITKESYDYIEKLAISIAEVDALESIAKPAISKYSSNCKYVTLPWTIKIKSLVIKGNSVCLVATKDIEPRSTLLYEQNEGVMLQAKERLLSKYPVIFFIGENNMVPTKCFDAPVKLEPRLVNFTTVEDKKKYSISFDKDLKNCYENKRYAKRRRIFLKQKGKTFTVEKIENPTHLK